MDCYQPIHLFILNYHDKYIMICMTNPSSNASNPSDELTQPTIRHHFVVIPAATPENWMPRRAGSQQVPAPHTRNGHP